MVIKREDLYETLRKQCPGKYSVGLHGINISRYRQLNYPDPNISDNDLSTQVTDTIINEGLQVLSGRTINGTVKFFGRLDDKASLQQVYNGLVNYFYPGSQDYIIVASPVEFTSENGDSFYVGATNLDSEYNGYFGSTGGEISTIFDEVALKHESTVDPMFILGSFKVLDDETIDLKFNETHISKRNGIMTDQEYNSYLRNVRLNLAFSYPGLYDAIKQKDKTKLTEALYDLSDYPSSSAHLSETITQLLNEENVKDLTPYDQETIDILKQNYRDTVERYRRQEEERRKHLESLKTLTTEELKEFAVTNPYGFSEIPEETKNNVELMREVTAQPGLKPILLCYLGDDVRNDPTTMINIVNNCLDDYFDYLTSTPHNNPNKSDLAYTSIGLDVRTDPLFWESLNTRILELNKTNDYQMDYFDTTKEIRLATEAKAKSTQTQY